MTTTLLRPEEVESVTDWANNNYRLRHRDSSKAWNGRVPVDQLVEELKAVLAVREKGREGRTTQLTEKQIEKQKDRIEAELRELANTEDPDLSGTVNLDDVLRYYSTDPTTRFDLQFVRKQHSAATSLLGATVYYPFVLLFTVFLLDTRDAFGSGYWMTAGTLDKFLDEEFTQSDELRFKKTFYDVMTDEEYWEFFQGPLVESIWQNGANERGNTFVQDSNMPIGAIKLRQMRVAQTSCGTQWEELRQHRATDQMPKRRILDRLNDYGAFCYPEYLKLMGEDPGKPAKGNLSFQATNVVHDGTQFYNEAERCKLDSANCNPNAFPVTYAEQAPLDMDSVPESQQFVTEAYKYRDCNALNSSTYSYYFGQLSVRGYGCDGFALIIPFNWEMSKVMKAMELLRDGIEVTHFNPFTHQNETVRVPWIDKQTRAVSIEMVLYNQNLDLFTKYQFFVEITAAGAFIPTQHTIGFALFDWEDHSWVYFFFLFLYFVWTMAYVGLWFYRWAQIYRMEMSNVQVHTWYVFRAVIALRSFADFWLVFDMISYLLFIGAWTMRFYTMYAGLTENSLLQNVYYPPDYDLMAVLNEIRAAFDALNTTFIFLRWLSFLDHVTPGGSFFHRTVKQGGQEIVEIFFIFALVFIAFAVMCFVVYGHVDEHYRSIEMSCVSLLLMLLGDFDYVALREADRIFTPIFFALFHIFAVFLLFNMMVAVLSDAVAQADEAEYPDMKVAAELVSRDQDMWKSDGRNVALKWKPLPWILHFPPIIEIVHFCKWAVLCVRRMTGCISSADYAQQMKAARDLNPRTYWASLEREFLERKEVTKFRDNLELTPKVLDDHLEETFGKDRAAFLYEAETGVEGLVLEAAKETHVTPKEMVEDLMSFLHSWLLEMSKKTFTGSQEDFEEVRRERHDRLSGGRRRVDPLDEFFKVNFAGDPQKRWEEQRGAAERVKAHLPKLSTDNHRKSEVGRVLQTKIQTQVDGRLDTLICNQINQILGKIMETDMTQWIGNLVQEGGVGAQDDDECDGDDGGGSGGGIGSPGLPPASPRGAKPAMRVPAIDASSTAQLAKVPTQGALQKATSSSGTRSFKRVKLVTLPEEPSEK